MKKQSNQRLEELKTSSGLNSEFNPSVDDFYNIRQKNKSYIWILKHLFYKNNKVFILTWLILATLSAICYSYIMIYIGLSLDSFSIGERDKLLQFTLIILAFAVASPILDLCGNFLREILAQRIEKDARHELYLNLLGKSQSFHDAQRIGDIMARATNDVRQLNYFISPAMSLIFEAFINILIPIVFIIKFYSYQLLLTPIIFLIFFVFALKDYIKKLGPVTQQIQIEYGNLNTILNESLAGIEVIKGMAQEKQAKRLYQKKAKTYLELGVKEGEIQAKYIPILMVALAITGGLVHAIILQQNGQLLIGAIIGYVGLLMNLKFPTNISIWAFAIMSRANSGAKRLIEIMNKTSEINEKKNPHSSKIKGKVKFDKVHFKYPGTNKFILKNFSFEALPGQTIAIVGATGSGKTTFTKLISRLYDIQKGSIEIDDIPIKDYSFHSLRDQIAYIEQDVFLFSKSFYENIAFGQKTNKKAVVKAAKEAQAHDFIEKLPKKYKTHVGERGVQLSGGERQRIAIARAFLSNPRILILDDSTSAIDSATEEKIQQAISHVLKGRTTFIITHRLSQIRWADKILVLKHGEVIAQGNHEHLLCSSDEYRKIFVTRFDKSLDELLIPPKSTKSGGNK